MHVTVSDPDDPHGIPIYDGDPFTAWEHLDPGIYRCTTDNTTDDTTGDDQARTTDSAAIPVVGMALCVTPITSFVLPVVDTTNADRVSDASGADGVDGSAS